MPATAASSTVTPEEGRLIKDSLARLGRCIDEGVAVGDASFSSVGDGAFNSGGGTSDASFDGCDLFWHIHVPKTGGTSVMSELKKAALHFELRHPPKPPTHFNFNTRGRFLEGYWSVLNATLAHHRPLFISEEIDLESIVHKHMPPSLLNRTCFFATVRRPDAWFLSALDFQTALAKGRVVAYAQGLSNRTLGKGMLPLEQRGVPWMAIFRQGVFAYDDLQSRHAAGGTMRYRRLFLLGSKAHVRFLAAATSANALTNASARLSTVARNASLQQYLNAAANHSEPFPRMYTHVSKHYSLDWRVWRALNASQAGIAVISPRGAMRCDNSKERRRSK